MQNRWCKVQHRNRKSFKTCIKALPFVLTVATSSWALTACSPTIATHGHTLDEAAIAQIEPGRSSQQEVLRLLGSPSSLASFDENAWFYVSQRTEKVSFYQETLVEQDVITVTFDDQNIVEKMDRHGLEQTAAIDPVDRETPTVGTAPSVMQQFIGNIGRFGNGSSSYDPDS